MESITAEENSYSNKCSHALCRNITENTKTANPEKAESEQKTDRIFKEDKKPSKV